VLARYYLWQRRLPDREHQTISCLEQIIASNPKNVLAEICLASVLLSNGRDGQAMQVLASCLKTNGKELVHRTLQHYFSQKLIMDGNYLLVHLDTDPAIPLMVGIMLARSQPEKTGAQPALPLDQYGWIFRFLPPDNKIENITDALLKEYKSKKELCSRPQTAEMDIIQYFREKPQLFLANEAILHTKTLGLAIDMTGSNPWFAFPLDSGFFAGKIEMQIVIDPSNKKIRQDNLDFYWSESKTPEFSEDRKISVPVDTDGRVQTVNLNLSENINWVASNSISALRVDPGNSPGHARIKKFKIPLCGISPSQ
jgi:hypothetical protein